MTDKRRARRGELCRMPIAGMEEASLVYAATIGHRLAALLAALQAALHEAPKSARWKLRARVGDSVAWYVLPDKVKQ
jgi:hypothetical protein